MELMGRLSSMSAGFTQRMVDESGEVTMVQTGVFRARSPNLFWWEIEEPYSLIYRLETPEVSIYDPSLNQVSFHTLDQSLQLPIVALLLNQDTGALEDYEVTRSRNSFELNPRSDNRLFEVVKIYFAGNRLDAIDVLDESGQRTEFSFHGLIENPEIDDAEFEFDLPADIETIGDPVHSD